MRERPTRLQVTNELGRRQTLPAGREQFEILGSGPETVFLGLGPEPESLPEIFPDVLNAYFIECQDFTAQVPEFSRRVPSSYSPIQPEAFNAKCTSQVRVIRYRPNLKAFPSFWGPLTARLALHGTRDTTTRREVWLPHGEKDLLGRELALAFKERGYTTNAPNIEELERSPGTKLPDMLTQIRPEIFLSINFKGLDPFGLGFNLLRESGVRVAVWLVDNPFNLLPALKSPYWREIDLFVTDASFIPVLQEAGALRVHHLPLAAWPDLFGNTGSLPDHARGIESRTIFVGRSKFPRKDRFHAGLSLPAETVTEARAMLRNGKRLDWFWWRKRLGVMSLWPDNAVRLPSLGAEESGRIWRSMCLNATDEVTVFGDKAWEQEGIRDVRPALDYYAHLPAVYREAAFTLNMTSPQLPSGLTQRHFDVWCAGGFLLTDATPGLNIFPHDMTQPVCFKTPDDIMPLVEKFRTNDRLRRELQAEWASVISNNHTYTNRVESILEVLGLN